MIWLKFLPVPVRRLITAAKGEVIARIDGAVKFLAQRRSTDCTIIIWHLAFDETKKRDGGKKDSGLSRKKNTVKEIMVELRRGLAGASFLRLTSECKSLISRREEVRVTLFFCPIIADECRQTDKRMTE